MPRIQSATWSGGAYLYNEYTIVAQSVSGNYSDIQYTFGIHFGTSYFNSENHSAGWLSTPGTGADDGDWSYAPFLPWPHGGTNQDYVLHSETFRVFHDTDGHAKLFFTFKLDPSAIGGGGTRSVAGNFSLPNIPRTSPAPGLPSISLITDTSFFVTFTDGSGGAPIDSRQIRYGPNADASGSTIVASDGSTSITGLTSGVTYYIWARTHNGAGYSPWSARATATTQSVPPAPGAPVLSEVTQVSVKVDYTLSGNGGSTILEVEVGYGTSPVSPTGSVSSASPATITGLTPGTLYYFRVRARNALGWGAWSPASTATTIAGVRINDGGVWKSAVPYINDSGTWKLARPWVKTAGVWKETT